MTTTATVGPSLPSGTMQRIVVMLVALVAGCGGSGDGAARARTATAAGDAPPPAVDTALPRTSPELADALSETTRGLEAQIRAWLRTDPGTTGRPPEAVTLYA